MSATSKIVVFQTIESLERFVRGIEQGGGRSISICSGVRKCGSVQVLFGANIMSGSESHGGGIDKP